VSRCAGSQDYEPTPAKVCEVNADLIRMVARKARKAHQDSAAELRKYYGDLMERPWRCCF
jgi:hypothetical protein